MIAFLQTFTLKKLTAQFEPVDYCWFKLQVETKNNNKCDFWLHFESNYNEYTIRNEIIQEYNNLLNKIIKQEVIEEVQE